MVASTVIPAPAVTHAMMGMLKWLSAERSGSYRPIYIRINEVLIPGITVPSAMSTPASAAVYPLNGQISPPVTSLSPAANKSTSAIPNAVPNR